MREIHARDRQLTDVIKELVNKKHNVLVFQPGKAEIAQTIESLENDDVKAHLLPLHGELQPAEQALVFDHYDLPKVVVATNVAQTSITIDDIDAVVDTGLERRVETVDGIEGLYIAPISLADRTQRKGRAGRTKEGVYYNCYSGSEAPSPYPKPEIQRHRLDQVVLRLALHDVDATELDFFHQPPKASLVAARATLRALGALDVKGQLTPIGRRMATLPVNVRYARMIVEAENRSVLDDILTIAAILEVKGIVERNNPAWYQLTRENKSDLLAQLDVYNKALVMGSNEERRKHGIHAKMFFRAKEIRTKLAETLLSQAKRSHTWVNFPSSGNRDDILKAIAAGMLEYVYQLFGDECHGNDNVTRKLGRDSVIPTFGRQLIVGEPIDIQITNRFNESVTLKLVTMASTVTVEMLQDVAEHLMEEVFTGISLSPGGEVLFTYHVIFNGVVVKVRNVPYTWQQLEYYQPRGMGIDDVRQELARMRFHEEQRSFLGALRPKRVPTQPRELLPQRYGRDPYNGETLLAYPSARKQENGWLVEWHFSPEEALAQTDIPVHALAFSA